MPAIDRRLPKSLDRVGLEFRLNQLQRPMEQIRSRITRKGRRVLGQSVGKLLQLPVGIRPADSVGLRGYAQKDPRLEYQREGYALFEEMNERSDSQAIDVIFKFTLPNPLPNAAPSDMPGTGPGDEPPEARPQGAKTMRRQPPTRASSANPSKVGKVGRNDPCTCGSGKKYKRCCGMTVH